MRFVEPLGLGGGLAGLATLGFCAVALSVSTIRAGNKKLPAMEALARRRRVHGEATTQPHAKPHSSPRYPLLNPEQEPSQKKNICVEDGRRRYQRRIPKSSFKPVESDQFQIGPRSRSRSGSRGLRMGPNAIRALSDIMRDLGYQSGSVDPANEKLPAIEATNCVFHSLAQRYPEVCYFDLALMSEIVGSDVIHDECMVRGGNVCRFKFKECP